MSLRRRKFGLHCSAAYQGRLLHWLWGLPAFMAALMSPQVAKVYSWKCEAVTAPIDGKSWRVDDKTRAVWTDVVGRRLA